MNIVPEIGSSTSPHAAEVEPPAAFVHAGGSIEETDDPCEGGQHCCCCGPGEACCDCGMVMPS